MEPLDGEDDSRAVLLSPAPQIAIQGLVRPPMASSTDDEHRLDEQHQLGHSDACKAEHTPQASQVRDLQA